MCIRDRPVTRTPLHNRIISDSFFNGSYSRAGIYFALKTEIPYFNKRLKEKLASAEKTISIWKQRYEAVNEKYMELKQKAQPFLDAIEIASERVWAFVHRCV